MLKVGIFGCGQIAKMHIPAIQKRRDAVIVGIADVNQEILKETAARFHIEKTYDNPRALLDREKPDIVHVLTPPFNHHELTKMALEAGCHVFVEKPVTMNAREAEDLLILAEKKGLKLCVGHSHLFDEIMIQARKMVDQGRIGTISGIESYYGFDLDPRYFSAKGNTHWAHQMPGGILMNRIDHPLSVVIPFMGKPKSVMASAVDVKDVIPLKIPGELRILLNDGKALASITVSLAAAPRFHELTLLGTKGTLKVDLLNKRLILFAHVPGLPKSISRAMMNFKEGMTVLGSIFANAIKVAQKKFLAVDGIPTLIHHFYEAIEKGAPSPVSAEQALVTMQVMDETWKQIGCAHPNTPITEADFPKPPRRSTKRVLVTGATGFLGRKLVKSLCEEGKADVRVLVRNPIKAFAFLRNLPVEVMIGDVSDAARVNAAIEGVDVVYHLAAAMGGTWEDYQETTVRGTERMVQAARSSGVSKFIYVSSIAVYGVPSDGSLVLKEDAPYANGESTDYMRSKIEAERIVLAAVRRDGLNATILRPGVVYGEGNAGRISRVGYKVGNLFVLVGLKDIELPLVYVGNVVKALELAASSPNGAGAIYNVVDDERTTKRGYIQRLNQYGLTRFHHVYFPYALLALMGNVFRSGSRFNGKIKKIASLLSPFHLKTCVTPLTYDNTKIKQDLGWKSELSLEECFQRMGEARD